MLRRWTTVMSLLATATCITLAQTTTASSAGTRLHNAHLESDTHVLIAQNAKQSELLNLINNVRREHNLEPLSFSESLASAAQVHVEDIVEHNYGPTHTGSDGSSVRDRAEREGYPTQFVGENVAAGHDSVEDTFEQWMNSRGHRENILNSNYTEAGIGYYLNAPDTTYDHYWVLVFGSPDI